MSIINRDIKAFIFDMDGVITDTIEGHYQTWKRLAAEEGLPFSRAINDKLRGLSRPDSLKILLQGREMSERDKQRVLRRKNEYFMELVARMTEADLLPGVKKILLELESRHIRLAVASSSRNARPILTRLGVIDKFEIIVDGSNVVRTKPAPDLFLKAAELLGIPPANCVVIEDAGAGIEAGLAAGMLTIGLGTPEIVGKAHYRYPNMEQVNLDEVLGTEK